jgi:hypothetical protein
MRTNFLFSICLIGIIFIISHIEAKSTKTSQRIVEKDPRTGAYRESYTETVETINDEQEDEAAKTFFKASSHSSSSSSNSYSSSSSSASTAKHNVKYGKQKIPEMKHPEDKPITLDSVQNPKLKQILQKMAGEETESNSASSKSFASANNNEGFTASAKGSSILFIFPIFY